MFSKVFLKYFWFSTCPKAGLVDPMNALLSILNISTGSYVAGLNCPCVKAWNNGCEDENIILKGSFRQNERENSMNPIHHSSSNMSTVPDVTRDEDTVKREAGHHVR